MVQTRRNTSKVGKKSPKIAHFFRFFGLNFFQRHLWPSNRARYMTYRNRPFFSKKNFPPTLNLRRERGQWKCASRMQNMAYRSIHPKIMQVSPIHRRNSLSGQKNIWKLIKNNELSFCFLSMIGFALGFLSINSNLKLISILFLIIYWYRENL